MSIAFGIALEREILDTSLPTLQVSQNLCLRGVWEQLEEIAIEKRLTRLSHFVVEDAELYQEMLDSADEFDYPECEDYAQVIQEKLAALAGQPDWFEPSDATIARATLRGLVESLQANPDRLTQYGHGATAAILADLEEFIHLLDAAEFRKIRFKFWME
ncbi:MAG: hypothetical protein KME16_25910 [Scytolyngbya sp. HA4215-MV1]|nr:hypothetical protein [Scytolyngbya sp. HA4215-MV1]